MQKDVCKPFNGGCEPLCEVDVADLVAWIATLDRNEWQKGSDRPYVIEDPSWQDFRDKTEPVVSKLLALFPGCTDTYRALTTINPGDYVPPHTDTQSPEWISRIHVPLLTNDGCWFITEGIGNHMEVGMAYQVNPGKPHAVSNQGKTVRVHLMFDVVQ